MTERVLFTTSNGTGLGHLTRSMAIARRLGPELEAMFITLSAAAPVVEQMGFPVEYVASYATPGSGNDYRWSRRLRARLRAAIAEIGPRVVVFDGTHPYEALLGALPNEAVTVWCRRPLWKAGSSRVPLGRAGAFDAVLEPGELAESEDRGPTVPLRDRAHCVDPIVLLDREELLPRETAEAQLGLDPDRPHLLVSLGQGSEVGGLSSRALEALAKHPEIQVAALSSALANVDAPPDGVVQLRSTYPMSRYFAAFDGAIAAAGYNAYHELIALGVPSLFVPLHRDTDDQPARARYAEAAGVGLGVTGPDDPQLEAQIGRLLDECQGIGERLAMREEPEGAREAAGWLGELATFGSYGPEARPSTRKAGRGRDFRRRWGTFISSLPQTALRLTRQQLTKPRARALVLAIGIPDDELPAALMAALAEANERPERTLVVTDSLALGRLRELGVGIEHVPGRDSRQAEIAGVPYEEFLGRRLELIRAERPRSRRVVVAQGGAPVP